MPIYGVLTRLASDSAANWASKNPVLGLGEYGLETDVILSTIREGAVQYKIGDGTSPWNDLPYEPGQLATTILQFLADLSVRVATTGNLTANYANGTAGVGRTLTATTNVVFPVTDGVTLEVGQEVLVWRQTDKIQNGPYVVQSLGVAGVSPWVLIGDTNADTQAELDQNVIFVINGALYGSKYFTQQTPLPVLGTSDIIYKRGIGGTASVVIPLDQIVWGTGDGISSDPDFTWDNAMKKLKVESANHKLTHDDTNFKIVGIDPGDDSESTYLELRIDSGTGDFTHLKMGRNEGDAGDLYFYMEYAEGKYEFNKPNFKIDGVDYVFPSALGAAGSVLTDVAGDGVLTWEAGGGGSVSETATQIVVGTGTGVDSYVNLKWDDATGIFTVLGATLGTSFILNDTLQTITSFSGAMTAYIDGANSKAYMGTNAAVSAANKTGVDVNFPSGEIDIYAHDLKAAFKPDSIELYPHGIAAGQTYGARFLELAANGTDFFEVKAPDNIATTRVMVWPNDNPAAGEVLAVTSYSGGVITTEWAAGGGGSFLTIDGATVGAVSQVQVFTTGIKTGSIDDNANGSIEFSFSTVGAITFNSAGIQVPNGTVGTPSLQFNLGAGFYQISGTQIGASIGGVLVGGFNATGVFADVISEQTTAAGVTIDGVLLKDSDVDSAHLYLSEQAGDPSNVANKGILYTKDVAGVTQLFYENSAGTVGQIATQAYADSLVVGLIDDRGNYDASVNTFPASGGSGTAGAVLKGDLWTISVAGTLGGHPVTVGDVVRALVDTPGQTDGNWAITENNFGYVALNQSLADGKIYVGNGSGIGTAVTPTGDVTMSNAGVTVIGASKVLTTMIADDNVTYAKIQDVSATDKILGRSTAGAGDVEEIPCTAAGRALLDDADAAAQLVTLGAAAIEEITTVADSATPTPTGGSRRNAFSVSALAQAATFAAPSGTPLNWNRLIVRIKDNGTARSLAWDAIYVAGGVALPTTTVLSKILTLGFEYDTDNSLNKWRLIASSQEA